MTELTPDEIIPGIETISSALGYSSGAPPYFLDLIQLSIVDMATHAKPVGGYRMVRLKEVRKSGTVLCEENICFHTDRIVASYLRQSEWLAVFACTIGDGMEKLAREKACSGQPEVAYVVDATASAAVEKLADVLHDQLASHMKDRGLGITNRYSPGYCRWDVSEQRILFSLLPEGFCGIRLSSSALMYPVKSISGVIGIGENAEFRDYECDHCKIPDCTYRQIRNPKPSARNHPGERAN